MRLLNLLERIGELPPSQRQAPPLSRHRRAHRAQRQATDLQASEVHGTFRGRPLIMTTVGRQRPTFRRRWTLVTVDLKNPEMISLHARDHPIVDGLPQADGPFKERHKTNGIPRHGRPARDRCGIRGSNT
jgi:hypothetical protein